MEITAKSFPREVLDWDTPVVVECWASWCLPCKQIEASLKRLEAKYRGRCKVVSINIDRYPQIANRYAIKGLPTVITFAGGKEIQRSC